MPNVEVDEDTFDGMLRKLSNSVEILTNLAYLSRLDQGKPDKLKTWLDMLDEELKRTSDILIRQMRWNSHTNG